MTYSNVQNQTKVQPWVEDTDSDDPDWDSEEKTRGPPPGGFRTWVAYLIAYPLVPQGPPPKKRKFGSRVNKT